jgi:hypothetical protein
MNLLERYTKTIVFKVDKPKQAFIEGISKAIQNIQVAGDSMEVNIKPSLLDPFAGRGVISLRLEASKENMTIINCKILPTSIKPHTAYLLIFFLGLISILALVFSPNFYTLINLALGWMMFVVFIHLTQLLSRGKLESFIIYKISSIGKTF